MADGRAVDDAVAIDDADSEAHELDLVLRIDAGHAGRFAAEQAAARASAALGDPRSACLAIVAGRGWSMAR